MGPAEPPRKALLGTHESDYFYDGESRRVRIKELESGTQTKDETFVWCGSRICQKRSGSTVERNYFDQGFEEGTTDYFYTRDHLGSVREVVGSDGTTVASRASYDPWGRSTGSGSGAVADFGFTGHYSDRPTGLGLTLYRAYDSNVGRWLSKDPFGLEGGDNLYGYVGNTPATLADRLGLAPEFCSFHTQACDAKCRDENAKRACRQQNGYQCVAGAYWPVKDACFREFDEELSGPGAGLYEAICNRRADEAFAHCIAYLCRYY